DALVVIRVYTDLAVVGGPMVGITHLLPSQAPVIRAKDAALFILDDSVDDVRIGSVDINTDSAGDAFRQAGGHPGPGGAAIYGLVEPTVGPAAVESVRRTPPLVGGRVQREGAQRVDRNVGYTRVLVDEKRSGPVAPSIGRLVESALLVWPPQVSEGGNIYSIGIAGVDEHTTDMF